MRTLVDANHPVARALLLGRRLNDVAARMSPSPEALARMERTVMAEFARAAAVNAPRRAAPRWPFLRLTVARRLVPVGLAASLALSSVAVALAESGPGQPLYRLRLDLETLTLPPAGTAARVDADLGRADARLGELVAASRSGDSAAADDSAAAYQAALAAIVGLDARQDAVAVATMLAQHEATLARAQAGASSGARQAMIRAARALNAAASGVASSRAPASDRAETEAGAAIGGTTAGDPADRDAPRAGVGAHRTPPGHSGDEPKDGQPRGAGIGRSDELGPTSKPARTPNAEKPVTPHPAGTRGSPSKPAQSRAAVVHGPRVLEPAESASPPDPSDPKDGREPRSARTPKPEKPVKDDAFAPGAGRPSHRLIR